MITTAPFRILVLTAMLFQSLTGLCAAEPWRRHTIDNGSRGADGVRLGDVNQDGLPDIVTGWEEGGRIRVCLQPRDTTARRSHWPTVEVGRVKSPEDAVFADVNDDAWLDVISCCEGRQQNVFVHLNPGSGEQLTDSTQWQTVELPGAANLTRWMFCEPLGDGSYVLGSKQPNAQITLWRSGLRNSTLNPLRTSGWIMSLRAFDIDRDGHRDVVYSDRKGKFCQVGWLKNPGDETGDWIDHRIGGNGREVMFLDIDASDDQRRNVAAIACNTKDGGVLMLTPGADIHQSWGESEITHDRKTGSGKGVAFGDVNGDGKSDLICTCEHSAGAIGVFWLEQTEDSDDWRFHDISGAESGVKFDRIEMLDVDQDGDLDVLTCEERDNLGVIWYENSR